MKKRVHEYPLLAKIHREQILERTIHGPLLVQQRRSKVVHYINFTDSNRVTKHKIADYDTFLAMNFTNKGIIDNIPIDILRLFEDGSDIRQGTA